MRHFTSVYTVCLDKNDLEINEIQFYLEIIARNPSIYTKDHLNFIVSNQKEESISVYRVNTPHMNLVHILAYIQKRHVSQVITKLMTGYINII